MARKGQLALLICSLTIVCCVLTQSTFGQRVPRGPYPVHDVIIDRFAIWLNLSPEQEAAVRAFRDRYDRQWQAMLVDEKRKLRELSQAHEAERFGVNFNQAELMRDIYRVWDLLVASMRSHDEQFFNEIEAILIEQQQHRMSRVRHWRRRNLIQRNLSLEWRSEATQVYLTDCVRIETNRSQRQFSGDEPGFIVLSRREFARLEPALDEYERIYISAMENFAREDRAIASKHFRRIDQYLFLVRNNVKPHEDPAAWDEVEQMERDVGRARLRWARELERINRFGLQLCMDHLPSEKAAEFRRMYRENAFRNIHIYPDKESAEPLYDALLAIVATDDDRREGVIALHEDYQRRHEMISQRMVETYIAYADARLMRDEGFDQESRAMLKELEQFGRDRKQLNVQQYQSVAAVILCDQMALLLVAETDRRVQIDRMIRRHGFHGRHPSFIPMTHELLTQMYATAAQRKALLEHVRMIMGEKDQDATAEEKSARDQLLRMLEQVSG